MDIKYDFQRSLLSVIDNSEYEKFVYSCVGGNPLYELVLLDVVVTTIKQAFQRDLKRKERFLKREKFIKVLLISHGKM